MFGLRQTKKGRDVTKHRARLKAFRPQNPQRCCQTLRGKTGVLDDLAGVAHRTRSDPFFQIDAAISDRAGRDFYKVRSTTAMPPILQRTDGVA